MSKQTPIHIEAMKDVQGWIAKSEPTKYSWEQFEKDKITIWDGVRNFAARNFLKEMKIGDEVFFYHSNIGLEIVGIAEVTKTYFQDPTTTDENWVSVQLKPKRKLKKTVTLDEMKNNQFLKNLKLIKIGRLSVSPVTKKEWETILALEKK